jgi:hypothetical protein
MNIGELFINLGIKGAEKTVGALGGVRKGLGEISSMSLEAKAGLLAVFYGLERLTQASNGMGTNLRNFNALTGLSAKSLQQWQYAARQAGISGEEMTGSIKGVQNAMTNMALGKGAPEGLGIIAQAVGGLDPSKLQDTFYMLSKLQEAARKLPAAVGNVVLKSVGLNEGTISAMRRGAFNAEAFRNAPTYSEREIQQLDKANIAWSNLSNKIQMAVGRWNAEHGPKLVDDISKLTDNILKLVDAFTKLADKLKLFEGLGKVFEGWGLIFDKTSSAISNGVDKNFAEAVPGAFKLMIQDLGKAILPGVQGGLSAPTGSVQSININQNMNFQHDGKDHQKTGESVRKGAQDAIRQSTAQGQGS